MCVSIGRLNRCVIDGFRKENQTWKQSLLGLANANCSKFPVTNQKWVKKLAQTCEQITKISDYAKGMLGK